MPLKGEVETRARTYLCKSPSLAPLSFVKYCVSLFQPGEEGENVESPAMQELKDDDMEEIDQKDDGYIELVLRVLARMCDGQHRGLQVSRPAKSQPRFLHIAVGKCPVCFD